MKAPQPPWGMGMELDLMYGEGKLHHAQIRKELEIDRSELDEEMKDQGRQHGWYASLKEYYEVVLARLDRQKKDLAARLTKQWRLSPPTEWGSKRPSKDLIDAEIRLNDDYQKLLDREEGYMKALALVKAATIGFADRKEMLRSLADRERRRMLADTDMTDERGNFMPARIRNNTGNRNTGDRNRKP